jgi:lycopene beta-cyclase
MEMARKPAGSNEWEAQVFGAGPAALCLATELGERGVRTRVVAPRPFEPWGASYGTFEEFLPSEYLWAVRYRYERPFWIDAEGVAQELGRPYVRLDTALLQKRLVARAKACGVQFGCGSLAPEYQSGSDALVIDATGRNPRSDGGSSRYQSAYGAWIRIADSSWLSSDQMLFMDLRAQKAEGPPSFLYAMPEGDLYFVQETSLVWREPVSLELLKARLAERLRGLGVQVREWVREERCLIPMGGLPVMGKGSSFAFGASAGLTQPSSGYHIARTFTLGAKLADTLVCAGGKPEVLARVARNLIWPWQERLKWRLFDYGAGLLADMPEQELGEFLRLFYTEPVEELTAFIDGRLAVSRVIRLMGRLYSRANTQLRRRLRPQLSQLPHLLIPLSISERKYLS